MNVRTTLTVIAASGIGVFVLRVLPFLLARAGGRMRVRRGRDGWRAFAQAVGPAAIAALLVVSLRDVPRAAGSVPWPMLTGLAATALVHRIAKGGLAAPTLVGTLVYGLVQALGG